MKKQKKESYFWTSYSDLMTSLFLVMLVLFVSYYIKLEKAMAEKDKQNNILEEQLTQIRNIQESTKDLDAKWFTFDEEFKKYKLNIKVQFEKYSNIIPDGNKSDLKEAGNEIANFLRNHSNNSYLVIIEGQASSDTYSRNYELSYERALSLLKFWRNECDIDFGDNCELQVAGSGDGKLHKGTQIMRDLNNEETNQRFLIHIIPKNIMRDVSTKN